MVFRQARRVAAVLVAALVAAFCLVTAGSQKADGAGAVQGCGATAVYAPDAALARTLGLPGDPGSTLGIAASEHVRWLRTLACRQVAAGRVLTRRAGRLLRSAGPAEPAGPPAPAGLGRGGMAYSYNWAGYLARVARPGYVQAQWRVPRACCAHDGANYTSIWPGLGNGRNGTELIQAGTEQDVSASGRGTDYFWFEMLPDQVQQRITNLVPRPGDLVSASAAYRNGTASFVVCDLTTRKCAFGSKKTRRPANQAEWMLERTAVCRKGSYWLTSVPAFKAVTIGGAYYDRSRPLGSAGHSSLVMTDDNRTRLAAPGPINRAGTQFAIARVNSGQPSRIRPRLPC